MNINWEYPTNEDEWDQCIALLQSLKNNLPSGKRLTIALSHATHVYDSVQDVPEQILSISDGIYLMTYDEGDSAWPSHSDVEKSIEAINNWVNLVTPTCEERKKLFLGSAFYGWHPVVDGERISYLDYILNNDTRWHSNPGDLPADARSKAIYTRDNGFGGVFVWELGYDLPADDSQSLLKAIDDVMPSFSGPTIVCNSARTFQLNNLPAGYTVSWSYSGNLVLPPVLKKCTTPCILLRAANASNGGPGWVQATISGPCGDVNLPKHDLWVGLPGNLTTLPNTAIYESYNSLFNVSAYSNSTDDHATFTWETFGGVTLAGSNTGANASFYSSSTDDCGTILVSLKNVCGTNHNYITVITGMGGDCDGYDLPDDNEQETWSVLISPNPAREYIDIVLLINEETVLQDQANYYEVSIYNINLTSDPVARFNTNSPGLKIPINQFPAGKYVLSVVVNNERKVSDKFIIQRR